MWILFVVFHVNGGSAMHSAEFYSRDACLVAQSAVVQQVQATGASGFEFATCVYKGQYRGETDNG